MNNNHPFKQTTIIKLCPKSDNEGFSLIELVAVVAVLSVLSAVSLSQFNGFQEMAADNLVKISLQNTFKECKLQIIQDKDIPAFTIMIDLARTNGYYDFYQEYDYIPREDGFIPPTTIGNCIGPLGAHRIGVEKVKGQNINGKLWMNLDTGEKFASGGITW